MTDTPVRVLIADDQALLRGSLALPAAVTIGSGWAGLSTLTRFGVVRPLPCIWDWAAPRFRVVAKRGFYELEATLTEGIGGRGTGRVDRGVGCRLVGFVADPRGL